MLAAVGLGHRFLRHKAILTHHIGYTRKGASIAQGMLEEPLYGAAFQGLATGINHALQEEVGLLELIEEEGIDLRKLAGGEVVLGNGLGTHDVETGEEPATTRGLLVGDTTGVDPHAEVGIHGLTILLVDGQGAQIRCTHSVAQGFVGRSGLIGRTNLLHHLRRDGSLLRLKGRSRHAAEEEGKGLFLHIQCIVYGK